MRLGDVANVQDSVEDIRNIGLSSGKPAVLIIVFRQPGANIIATVDRVRAALPLLQVFHFAGDRRERRDGPHHHGARLGA